MSNGMTVVKSQSLPCLGAAENNQALSAIEEDLKVGPGHAMGAMRSESAKFSKATLFFEQSNDEKLPQKVSLSWEIVDALPDLSEKLNSLSKKLWLFPEQKALNIIHIQWGNALICRIMEIGHLLNCIHYDKIPYPYPEAREEIYLQWLEISAEKIALTSAIGNISVPAHKSEFMELLGSNDFDKGLMGVCTILGSVVAYLAGVGVAAPFLIAVSIPFGLGILGGIIRVIVSISGGIAAQKTKNAERIKQAVFDPLVNSLEKIQDMFNITAPAAQAILYGTAANTKAVAEAGESLNNLHVSTNSAAKELSEVRKEVADLKALLAQRFGTDMLRSYSNDSAMSDMPDLRIGHSPPRLLSPDILKIEHAQAELKKEFSELSEKMDDMSGKMDDILKAIGQNKTNIAQNKTKYA